MAIDHDQPDTEHHTPPPHPDDAFIKKIVIALAVLATLLLSLVAYTYATRDNTPATTKPTPAPTPAPTAAQRAQDEAAALKTLQAAGAAADKAIDSGTTKGTRLDRLYSQGMLTDFQEYLESGRRSGYATRGHAKVTATAIQWSQRDDGVTRVSLRGCSDISAVKHYDRLGNLLPNYNPDGTLNKRTRIPITYYIQSRGDGTYYVDSAQPDENTSATC